MADLWKDTADRLLARSIFGTDDQRIAEAMVLDWVSRSGFGRTRLGSIELSVGAGITVELEDQSKIFVKVWPCSTEAADLAAQLRLQRLMAARGFPAPAILSRLSPLGAGRAVAMSYNRDGVPTDVRIPGVRRRMAEGLSRLVTEAEMCRSILDLPRRDLPREDMIWPKPHNVLFDFAATSRGAEWIDEIAQEALAVMRNAASPTVVGHHDWSAKNMRMGPDEIAVVYDWDAIFLDHETFMLGSAAAHFPVTWELPVPQTPSAAEVVAFVHGYETARGRALTAAELREAAASATYARAYKARCEHALDPGATRWLGSSRESLKANGPYRFD
jgi:Phosphotransferase enzyme family